MKLSELIIACGDDKVEFQNLDHCLMSIDYSAKKGTRISFGTEIRILPDRGTEKLGLIVWLDRKAVADAVAAAKELRR